MRSLDIAVVGSGIAGLSAAWLLSRKHKVTLYEKESHIGGHSNTQFVETDRERVPVDTGFIVYNEANYPNLTALFDCLDVPTCQSNMSFAYSLDGGRYEYSGTGINGLFGQKANLVNFGHWRMLKDIKKFFASATSRIESYPEHTSLGEFLGSERYSRSFCEDHILPMAAAIWSSPADDIRSFPARSFIDFYSNHGLLKIRHRPKWRTVRGGSREYVKRILADAQLTVCTDSPVSKVDRRPDHVEICELSGRSRRFDQVVFACHGDMALKLLQNPSEVEQELLGNFQYSDNLVVLHKDATHMPMRHKLWSSWNYLKQSDVAGSNTSITYWMNRLQPISSATDLFVTVNPNRKIDPKEIFYQTNCRHPVMDAGMVGAQRDLWQLQGRNRSWYCGSYFGYGFHEDALQSGLAVAEELGGVRRPWNVNNESGRIHLSSDGYAEAAE